MRDLPAQGLDRLVTLRSGLAEHLGGDGAQVGAHVPADGVEALHRVGAQHVLHADVPVQRLLNRRVVLRRHVHPWLQRRDLLLVPLQPAFKVADRAVNAAADLLRDVGPCGARSGVQTGGRVFYQRVRLGRLNGLYGLLCGRLRNDRLGLGLVGLRLEPSVLVALAAAFGWRLRFDLCRRLHFRVIGDAGGFESAGKARVKAVVLLVAGHVGILSV